MLLRSLITQLALERSITRDTEDQYRRAVHSYGAYIGRDPTVKDLTTDSVNRWLQSLERGYRPISQRGKKVGLLVVWNYAAELGLVPRYDARRIRKIRLTRSTPKAWDDQQIAAALAAAEALPGSLKCGITAADAMTAYIRVNYEAGLRQSDLLRLRFCDVTADGVISIVQRKTGRPLVTRVSEATVAAVDRIRPPVRDRLWPLTRDGLRHWTERILARVPREHRQGLNTLRKSHASTVARTRGIAEAAASLGHVGDTSTARDWYIEPAPPTHHLTTPCTTNAPAATK